MEQEEAIEKLERLEQDDVQRHGEPDPPQGGPLTNVHFEVKPLASGHSHERELEKHAQGRRANQPVDPPQENARD